MQITLRLSFIAIFLLILCCTSCNEEQKAKSDTQEEASKIASTAAPIIFGDGNYCFQNESTDEDSGDKDVLELEVNVKNGFANGTYNWLPASKDQRKGRFRGQMVENVMKGEYSFVQGGNQETVQIEISLTERQAIVKSQKPELGIDSHIGKVDCQ